jgi:hypothetical protein
VNKSETKNPIKNLPMRQPGQSSREEVSKIFDDDVVPHFVVVVVFFVLAIFEWYRYFAKAQPHPVLFSLLFFLVLLIAIRKAVKIRPRIRQVTLGEMGEQAVGQLLEEKLRPVGCQIFNDILSENFNVDHFVVGPTGLFSVETKTCSKPAKGCCRVAYDGESVTVNGFTPDRDPIVQAKAEARWMANLIEQSTGKRFPVQSVVVYPGWYVETTCQNPEVWVLNDTVAPIFIKNARGCLSSEDVSLIAFHLKRYVISNNQRGSSS